MRIDVQLFGSRAEIVVVPSFLTRVLFRERTQHSFAVKTRAGDWLWDFSGKRVDCLTLAAIHEATQRAGPS